MWVWLLVAAVAVVLLTGWALGYFGGCRVRDLAEAAAALDGAAPHLQHGSGPVPVAVGTGGPHDLAAPPPGQDRSGASGGQGRGGGAATFWDAAIPGGLAAATGIHDWWAVDPNVLAAAEHLSGQSVDSILDLHRLFHARDYQWMSTGMAISMRGHVFEQQIVDQIRSWAPDGAVTMPSTANFPGADVALFGRAYQVKTNADFTTIDNKYGHPLIVPYGTANVPDEALQVNFADPNLDPATLEGHGVIVAKGLSASGAAGAWDDTVGGLADGVDAGDAADLGEALVLPGLGSAVRVGSSAWRRRAALTDDDTRGDAVARIARDGAEGFAWVAILGSVGGAIGMGADALGAMGLGMLTGKALGAAVGGIIAGRRARRRDQTAVTDARNRTVTAIAAYGAAADTATAAANQHWATRVADTEQRLRDLTHIRRAELAAVQQHTRTDLAHATTLTPDQAATLLTRLTADLRDVTVTGWSLPALRRRRSWQAHVTVLTAQPDPASTRDILVASYATRPGQARADAWLADAVTRRDVILAASAEATRAVTAQALRDRVDAATGLAAVRDTLMDEMDAKLRPLLTEVQTATDDLQREMRIAGIAPPPAPTTDPA